MESASFIIKDRIHTQLNLDGVFPWPNGILRDRPLHRFLRAEKIPLQLNEQMADSYRQLS
nr:hypothetical protein Q903MT_gene1677 [Picea sitchensis]